MDLLRKKIRELFDNQKVNLVIGYTEGFSGNVRPFFVTSAEESDKLIWDERCQQNLIVYLHKPEIKAYGKIGVTANVHALRTILQLAAENQIPENSKEIITVDSKGKVIHFSSYDEIEEYLAELPFTLSLPAKAKITEIDGMTRENKWKFWMEEFSSCIKCYACRSACPLCYCSKCTTESNQPQWIKVAPTGDGNFEWHIMRAMHLAGRCIECGECIRACPMGIPLGLLTAKLNEDISAEFKQRAGTKASIDYALGTFNVSDKENFIR